jgi:lysophospholipase L1-like esterase
MHYGYNNDGFHLQSDGYKLLAGLIINREKLDI